MKNALKAAFPTVLAVVLAWVAIEAIKYARTKYQAEVDAKKIRAMQQQATAAAVAADQPEDAN